MLKVVWVEVEVVLAPEEMVVVEVLVVMEKRSCICISLEWMQC